MPTEINGIKLANDPTLAEQGKTTVEWKRASF